VAALDDPQRARLYAFVRSARSPVTREEAAAAAGISRKLAAFHLDRLVAAGLLTAGFESAPADAKRIGRAPKRYRMADIDVVVTIPERRYDVIGEILLEAVSDTASGEAPFDAVRRVARQRGRDVGVHLRTERRLGRLGPERALTTLTELLTELGFEPHVAGDVLIQSNCPFHRLAHRSPELVCGINQAFVDGLLEGLQASRLRAELAPAEGRCCVVVTVAG
jgi:predicted ArsR family transcriptional regulator